MTKKKPIKKLTKSHKRFCQEYLIDFNGARAYRTTYPNCKSGHKQSANVLLTNPYLRKELSKLIADRSERTEITADEVLKEAARIALADIGEAFEKDGTLKAIHDMPEDVRRAISGLEVVELYEGTGKNRKRVGTLKKVKFWSKDKQVELLMRYLGLFLEDNKQTGQSLAAAIHEAMKDEK